jgi:hypothetical protein
VALAESDLTPPTPVPWDEFKASWVWNQGEHELTLGPTGSGKTTLLIQTLDKRDWVVFLETKPKDRVIDYLRHRAGYRYTRTWPPKEMGQRFVFHPPRARIGDRGYQGAAVYDFFEAMYSAGGWTIVVDELQYITDELKADGPYKTILHQGRSINLTCVTGSQRPAFVPVVAYSSATHLFLFKTSDKRDLERVRDIAGAVDPREIQDRLVRLPADKHWALYVNSRTGQIQEVVAPKIG